MVDLKIVFFRCRDLENYFKSFYYPNFSVEDIVESRLASLSYTKQDQTIKDLPRYKKENEKFLS